MWSASMRGPTASIAFPPAWRASLGIGVGGAAGKPFALRLPGRPLPAPLRAPRGPPAAASPPGAPRPGGPLAEGEPSAPGGPAPNSLSRCAPPAGPGCPAREDELGCPARATPPNSRLEADGRAPLVGLVHRAPRMREVDSRSCEPRGASGAAAAQTETLGRESGALLCD